MTPESAGQSGRFGARDDLVGAGLGHAVGILEPEPTLRFVGRPTIPDAIQRLDVRLALADIPRDAREGLPRLEQLPDDFGLAPAVVLDLVIQSPEFSDSLNDALSITIEVAPANVRRERRRSGGKSESASSG